MAKSSRSSRADGPYLVVSYDQQLSTSLTNELLCQLARHHLDRLSPAGWSAAGYVIADCITSGDIPYLCQYDPDVLDLEAADQYNIRQCLAFFGKRKDIDLGLDREAAALRKFRDAEEACRLTNSCFRAWSQGRFQFRPEVERVLHASQLKIDRVLGDCPSIREIRPRFGPGATTQVPKRNACAVSKLQRVPACSANLTIAEEAMSTIFVGNGEAASVVDVEIHAARLAFVPKNAKTERAICTEPSLNGMFQLGIGDEMANRLRAVGIDIRDQGANQRAAMYGSLSGDLATLDLSSASDTVALELVRHLFSPDWFDLLSNFRSAMAEVDGGVTVLEKISSMGNGFTFPLETLVFWAIAQSVVDIYAPGSRYRTLVYGDDIIVPRAAAIPLMRVLRELGFTPNPSKSFWEGNFRESCGKDYVFGIDVRPVYVDDALTGAALFTIHNFYYARGEFLLAKRIESYIHPAIRLRGPQGYGDGHLHSRFWRATAAGRQKGWSGFTFETWAHRPKMLKREIVTRLAKTAKNGNLTWEPRAFALVRRVATYLAHIREDTAVSDRMVPDPVDRKDSDVLVVPGKGKLCRTKVYTFEPPYLH